MEQLTETEKAIEAWKNVFEVMKNENGNASVQISLDGSPFLDIKLKSMNKETAKKFWEFWDSFRNQLENSKLSLSEFLEFFYFK
jgi:2,4-dienoyl-CoA reductase-like NADH-dependent reductase (Old Yellow Enzyme family)